MTYQCELCWAEFDTEEELAQHIEIEEHLTYRVDGEGYAGRGSFLSGRSVCQRTPAEVGGRVVTISDTERRQVLRQLDRDVDARFKLDQLDKLSDDLYPSHDPSPFWTFMEDKTECPECGTMLNLIRLCPDGCLDELELELNGDPRVGGIPGTRDWRGWERK